MRLFTIRRAEEIAHADPRWVAALQRARHRHGARQRARRTAGAREASAPRQRSRRDASSWLRDGVPDAFGVHGIVGCRQSYRRVGSSRSPDAGRPCGGPDSATRGAASPRPPLAPLRDRPAVRVVGARRRQRDHVGPLALSRRRRPAARTRDPRRVVLDDGRARSVLYSGSVSEIVAPYGDPSVLHVVSARRRRLRHGHLQPVVGRAARTTRRQRGVPHRDDARPSRPPGRRAARHRRSTNATAGCSGATRTCLATRASARRQRPLDDRQLRLPVQLDLQSGRRDRGRGGAVRHHERESDAAACATPRTPRATSRSAISSRRASTRRITSTSSATGWTSTSTARRTRCIATETQRAARRTNPKGELFAMTRASARDGARRRVATSHSRPRARGAS